MNSVDSATQFSLEKFRPLKQMYIGQVVDVADPEGLARVRVEIPGLTHGVPKDSLPWYSIKIPVGLGGSTYTSSFAVPQPNTLVYVEYPTEDIYAGLITGVVITRQTLSNDKLNLSADYIHPTTSESHFTKKWDESSGSKNFSCDMTEDYPFSWGWVSNAMTWFRENMMKRTLEFVHNSFTKFKIYGNGDTVLHVTGNMKFVVEKDFYMEVRGNRDLIVFNSNYEHILGQSIRLIEKTDYQEGKKGMILKGLVIQEN